MDWIGEADKERGILPPGGRCFRREVAEKLLDTLNFVRMAKQNGELNRQQWKHLDNTMKICLHALQRVCESRFLLRIDYERWGEMLGAKKD